MGNREEYINILKEKKAQAQKSLSRLSEIRKEYMEGIDESSTKDELDLAQREISMANVYAMIERKTKELREIESLLERLETQEEFGVCEECGSEIPLERLIAMPGTTLCVDCQAEYEKQGRTLMKGSEGIWTKDYEGLEWTEEVEEDLGMRETTLSPDSGQEEGL
ncbi:MAG: TraR/DksA family transcriptional regulator [Desulfatiglandales bacterium]